MAKTAKKTFINYEIQKSNYKLNKRWLTQV